MKNGVTKKEFIKSLENTLKLTRDEITEVTLSEDEEKVFVFYEDKTIVEVNIACDSAIAIMKDVSQALLY